MELTKLCILKPKKAPQVRTESLGLSASDRAGWTHPQWRRPMSPMQVGSLLGRALRGGERSPFTVGLLAQWREAKPAGTWPGIRFERGETRAKTTNLHGESSGEDTQLASSGALLSKDPETSLCSLRLSFDMILCTCEVPKIKYNVQKIH